MILLTTETTIMTKKMMTTMTITSMMLMMTSTMKNITLMPTFLVLLLVRASEVVLTQGCLLTWISLELPNTC